VAKEDGGWQDVRYVKFRWSLGKPLEELEKKLREYGVDWVSMELRAISEPKLIVEVDVKDREAVIKVPEFIQKEPWYSIISLWIARYREKHRGVERMEREMLEYFKKVIGKMTEKEASLGE